MGGFDLESLRKLAASLGQRTLIAIGSAGVILVAGLLWLALSRGGGDYAYLYTDLDPAGAQAVTEKLTQAGVPFRLSGDGTAILAPADRIPEMRMMLAGEQLGGKVGYAVIDAEDAFGTSAAKSRINQTRAIEGELARSIESLTAVSKARVHLVMPERPLFATEAREASASVTLRTGARLGAEQVDAIRHLVAAAVPELQPSRISIIDQNGTLLARAGDEALATGSGLDQRQAALQARLREQVESMLEQLLGTGRARAEVAVQLDADQIREESDVIDPDRTVIARETIVERSDEDSESNRLGGPVSIATALPGVDSQSGDDARRKSSANENSSETTYETSRTRTTRVSQGGAIERITVSVMVDGSYVAQGDGRSVYVPRTRAELERITRLVENAIGYDEARGDSVVVENLRFAAAEDATAATLPGLPVSLERRDLMTIAQLLIVGLVALAALAWVVRPLISGAGRRPAADPLLLQRAAGGDGDALAELQLLRGQRPALDQGIDVAQVEGQLKASVVRRVGEVVERHPAEATAIVRQWMYS